MALVFRNLSYGPQARHRLDIYPARRMGKTSPVVLFFHGGSWRKGDKRLYRWLGRTLARRGFTTVIPNYRLFPQAPFPGFMEDAAQAVGWTRRCAAHYGGNPNQIHVMGHSAGAHMAALLALDETYLGAATHVPAPLASVVGIAGPYAMDPLKSESVRPIFENAPDLDRVRPIKLVDRKGPRMLLLHGARDNLVPSRQSEQFHAALTENGSESRTIIYPGLGHIEILLAMWPYYRWRAPVLRDVVRFLRAPVEEDNPDIAARRPLLAGPDIRRVSG